MEILFLLVPMSVVLALAVLAVFAFALDAGQFDDLGVQGERILDDDPLDVRQAGACAGPEQSISPSPDTPR